MNNYSVSSRIWTCGQSVCIATLLLLSACSPSEQPVALATVVDDVAMSDEIQGHNWLAFGRTHNEQRFSPLDQVNSDSVADLKVDWFLNLPKARGLVSTPLVVDGIMYFVTTMNRVHAVNGKTGRVLWEYDPKVNENTGTGMRVGWSHSRGIGIWKDKVYVATWDGRLNAIDIETGQEVWSVRTFGIDEPLYITGAPKIFKGMVLIGNGGTEHGPARGYVTAYNAENGEQVWRFHIVPGNPADGFESNAMRMAAKTWTGSWWLHGGGGNAWHGFTYDAELDQLYIGTGNGAPWNRKIRSPYGGDNLFLSSIVALDPDTGNYIWHYQTTPGESWDYNSNMDIVLADLTIEDQSVKALMHAPKNGFFYVINRETGALISANAFTNTTWASHIDLETGRPVEVSGARYESGPARVSPTPKGGHSWHAMSFNPQTGLAYIPAMHLSAVYSDQGVDHSSWKSGAFLEGDTVGVRFAMEENADRSTSTLQAWDPVQGLVVWENSLPGTWNAGTMTTAGNLVFQGRASGDLVAYDARNGDRLWKFNVGLGISAPPITYAIDDKQYVSVLVGWGGSSSGTGGPVEVQHGWAYGVHPRRLITFSLDGSEQLPASPPPVIPVPIPMPDFSVNLALAAQGEREFLKCFFCHGGGAVSAGMAPDLRASAIVNSAPIFADIVRTGSRSENGMPVFSHLSDRQLLSLRHYIRRQAEAAIGNGR